MKMFLLGNFVEGFGRSAWTNYIARTSCYRYLNKLFENSFHRFYLKIYLLLYGKLGYKDKMVGMWNDFINLCRKNIRGS